VLQLMLFYGIILQIHAVQSCLTVLEYTLRHRFSTGGPRSSRWATKCSEI